MRTCEVAECGRAHLARGYCKRHYRRWSIYGDPIGKAPSRFKPRDCVVPGCGVPLEPMKNARGMCYSHYSRTLREGSPERQCETCSTRLRDSRRYCSVACRPPCKVCGGDVMETPYKSTDLCSWRCVGLYRRFGTDIPRSTGCSRCGEVFQLFERLPSGRWRKLSRIVCDGCTERRWTSDRMAAGQVAKRDGNQCRLCLEMVDLALTRTGDLMRASVDHIIPRSHGGTDEPDNLQLAHLLCNMRKGNRLTAPHAVA